MKNRLTLAGCVASILALSGSAHAQATGAAAIPAETVKAQTATTGSTEVAKGGFATGALPAEEDEAVVNDVSLAAGGMFASGNARTVAITSLAKARIRRYSHQFSGAATGNFARAGKASEGVDTTVENYQGLLRYDYFFTNHIAAFLQNSGRRDRFQGLDLRYNLDPGVAYYFINEKARRLQVELGYDLQYDVRRDASRVSAAPAGAPAGVPPTVAAKTQTLHNVRSLVGFENQLYKQVSFVTSLEYLQSVEHSDFYRLIFDAGLKTNIAEKLAIATTYTMRYENRPLPSVLKADSIASVNLVYSLF